MSKSQKYVLVHYTNMNVSSFKNFTSFVTVTHPFNFIWKHEHHSV